MEIIERREAGAMVALLQGRMDADTVPVFDRWFAMHVDMGTERIILDLSGLLYISSGGLRAILSAARELKKRKGLAICGLYGMVRQVFQVSGFMAILEIHPTADEAVTA